MKILKVYGKYSVKISSRFWSDYKVFLEEKKKSKLQTEGEFQKNFDELGIKSLMKRRWNLEKNHTYINI